MPEQVTTFTPLGIRFWDSALNRQVGDYLRIKAYRTNRYGYGVGINAVRSASGIYAFHGLPGMREIETQDFKGFPSGSPATKKNFIVEVNDMLGRFLPLVFKVDLPLSYLGIYSFGNTDIPKFNLFSSANRVVPPGMATIRANLLGKNTGTPAPHAVMEVQVDDEPGKWYGISDKNGNILILFPYPAMQTSLSAYSPGETPRLTANREWKLNLKVNFAPQQLEYPVNANIPLLESIIKQSAGNLEINPGTVKLTYGQELILKTEQVGKSDLLIEAAT